MLPALVLQILLTVLLLFLTIQSSFKAKEIYVKENVEKKKKIMMLEEEEKISPGISALRVPTPPKTKE